MNISPQEYWRTWFGVKAASSSSEFELNRCSHLVVSELEERAQQQLMDSLQPRAGDRLLDAGCGSGVNISLLAQKVHTVTGVDFSPEMIERAARRCQTEKFENVDLRCMDITTLDLPDASYDKVLCASVLQYLPARQCDQAIEELCRVCKPGGRLILHVKNSASLYGVLLKITRLTARCLRRSTQPDYYRPLSWYEAALSRRGATLLDVSGFGWLTSSLFPQKLTQRLLRWELNHPLSKRFSRHGVNCQILALR